MDTATPTLTGGIVQVIGPVVDVDFSASGHLPKIFDALTIEYDVIGKSTKLTFEVQQHLGEGRVRAIAMSSTEGLKRGMQITNTNAPISVPVGNCVLGPRVQRHRGPGGRPRTGQRDQAICDSPQVPGAHRSGHEIDGAGDRHQGHRPDLPVHEGREGRGVRRRGCRQDGRDHGVDQ